MAIYHFTAKIISRSRGQNAIASAAYRRAAALYDEQEDTTYDYTKKQHVIHSELLVPNNSPEWAQRISTTTKFSPSQSSRNSSSMETSSDDPHAGSEYLWNLVERHEKRKDSQLAREFEFSLPIELSVEQNIILAREFISDQCVPLGMIADWSIHWDAGNPHVHVMLTMRELTLEGFGKKVVAWNHKDLLENWRARWADYANFHLHCHQHDVRIDHRSYAAQGIDLVPSVHQGKAVMDMEKRGLATERAALARQIREDNLERIIQDPNQTLLAKVTSQRSHFSETHVGQAMQAYVSERRELVLYQNQTADQNMSSASSSEKVPTITTAHDGNSDPTAQAANVIVAEILKSLNETTHADQIPLQAEEPTAALKPEKIAKLLSTIEHHEAVFSEKSIALALGNNIDNADLFSRALLEIKTSNQLIPLGLGDDGRERFTTQTMIDLESSIEKIADQLAQKNHQCLGKRAIEHELARYEKTTGKTLTVEQRHAVKHLLDKQSISCLVGRAGTGKSFSLGAAHAVWQAKKFTVHGIALSGIAADGLARDAGIAARTIESFRLALEKGNLFLNKQSVVVMDEAGMTDSVSMLAVLDAVQSARAKLVLVGDPDQLQPVGPGAVFRALLERVGFAEIQTVYRQKETWQQLATQDFAAGRTVEAINAYEQHGFVLLAQDENTALQQLINDWRSVTAPLNERLVLAYRNEDVDKLNRLCRATRVANNELADGHEVKTRCGLLSIAKDERILFLKNDKRLGVSNGRFATINHVEFTETGRVLWFDAILDGEAQQQVRINPQEYSDFSYGYAATVHRSQGTTFDETFVYAGGFGWVRQLMYVAMSRHRNNCRLYAEKNTYPDLNAFKNRVSRLGLKDSVLDFPKAFAERRGIELADKQQKMLSQRLQNRLQGWKATLAEKAEIVFRPEQYWQKQQQKVTREEAIEKIYQQRSDARLVAEYVDAHCEVGKSWQALNTRMQRFGLKTLDYRSEHFSILEKTPEFVASRQALLTRDKLAKSIVDEIERYSTALSIYGLDLKKLHEQATAHERREKVALYLDLNQAGKTVLADRIAFELMQNLKAYYHALKSSHIDLKNLRKQAIKQIARKRIASLSYDERKAFNIVRNYVRLSQKIGQQQERQHTQLKQGNVLNREAVIALQALSHERDARACQIAANPEQFDQALDFYQIGKASPLIIGQDITEQQTQWASARWYKLQTQAARFSNFERLNDYQSAVKNNNKMLQLKIANDIIQDTRAHHPAVLAANRDTSSLWHAIRQDAKAYAREQYINSLTSDHEKSAFIRVENYIEAKRAHGKAWRELFETQKQSDIDKEIFYKDIIPALTPLFEKHSVMRDSLAAQILENIPQHLASLNYFKIDVAELNKPAYQDLCRERVKQYIAITTLNRPLIERAAIAHEIIRDPKAHLNAIKTHDVDLRVVYREANTYERQQLFATLTLDEKKLARDYENYRRYNKRVGQTYAGLQQYTDKKSLVYINANNKLLALLAKRDALAYRTMNQQEKIRYNELFGDAISLTSCDLLQNQDTGKLEKQAHQHQSRVERITAWHSLQKDARSLLRDIVRLDQNPPSASPKMSEWLSIQSEMEKIARDIQWKLRHYRAAFHDTSISEKEFIQSNNKNKALKEQWATLRANQTPRVINTGISDTATRKAITQATRIAKETQPISGTLAERYLREHRSIKGTLPDSFRFHPNHWNSEAQQKMPALVVVAKNSQNKLRAIQIISLDTTTANKAALKSPKITRGTLKDEAMGVLVNRGTDNHIIAIAEGPETALSIKDAYPDLTIYCTLGVANFKRVPIHSNTKQVLMCADNDGVNSASQRQVKAAAEALAEKNVDVWQAMPDSIASLKKTDFNDVLKHQGVDAVKNALQRATLIKAAVTVEQRQQALQEKIGNILDKPVHSPNSTVALLAFKKDALDNTTYTTSNTEDTPAIKEIRELLVQLDTLKENPDNNRGQILLVEKTLKTQVKWLTQKPAEYQQLKTMDPVLAERIAAFAKKLRMKW